MPPGLFRSLDRDRDDKRIIVRHDYLRAFADLRQQLSRSRGRELPRERVVDLHQDLDFRDLGVNPFPDLVDDVRDRGLGLPGDSFRKDRSNSIEDVPPIAKTVLDKMVLGDLSLNTIVPSLNTRMRTEPNSLGSINFVYSSSGMRSHSCGSADVVRAMAEYLCEFAD